MKGGLYLDLAFCASFLSFLFAATLPALFRADSIISVDSGTMGRRANAPVCCFWLLLPRAGLSMSDSGRLDSWFLCRCTFSCSTSAAIPAAACTLAGSLWPQVNPCWDKELHLLPSCTI